MKEYDVIFNELVHLKKGENCLIIYDETFLDYLPEAINFLTSQRIQTSAIYVPLEQQMLAVEFEKIAKALASAIFDADVILTGISSDVGTTAFRRRLIKYPRVSGSRLAHLTNVNNKLLRLIAESGGIIHRIHSDCEMLAWHLGQGSNIKIQTYDSNGVTHSLDINKKKWAELPIISSGIIHPGSWGNPVPGETFICPDHSRVNGSICINGSIPGILIGNSDLILEFKKGKLVSWLTNDQNVKQFFEFQRRNATENKDMHWNSFCELGFGMNRLVGSLTGNMMFDEKKAGTLHVAIGNNEIFGSRLKSKIHLDLVTVDPTVQIDGEVIMTAGEIAFSRLEMLRKAFEPEEVNKDINTLRIFKSKIHLQNGSVFRVVDQGDRLSMIEINSNGLSHYVSKLMKNLKETERIDYAKINRELGTGAENTVRYLLHFGIAKTYEND